MTETTEPTKVYQNNLTDLASFNSYGVVTLQSGQKVNVQFTMRHGMAADKMLADFNEYLAYLNGVTDLANVEFWDGSRGASSNGNGKSAASPTATSGGNWSWMQDAGSALAKDKGKPVLLLQGGEPPEKVPCPIHAGKSLYLKSNDKGRWYSHKADDGRYCNANLRHAPVDAGLPPDDESPF